MTRSLGVIALAVWLLIWAGLQLFGGGGTAATVILVVLAIGAAVCLLIGK